MQPWEFAVLTDGINESPVLFQGVTQAIR